MQEIKALIGEITNSFVLSDFIEKHEIPKPLVFPAPGEKLAPAGKAMVFKLISWFLVGILENFSLSSF